MRETGRSQFLYSLRTSLLSAWKVGTKKGYWKPGKTGDVWMVVFSLMLLNIVHDYNSSAITSGIFRRGISLAQGGGAEEGDGEGEATRQSNKRTVTKEEKVQSSNPSKRIS